MIGFFKYDKRFDESFRMPLEMLPPESLYRFIPDNSCIFTIGMRVIFEGGIAYTKKEVEELAKFINYVKTSNLPLDRRFTFPEILKCLQSSKFNHSKTYTKLVAKFERVDRELPVEIDPDIVSALVSGGIKVDHGLHAGLRTCPKLPACHLRPLQTRRCKCNLRWQS
eukprot:TRINITY_DN860_c0_g1_i6.p1 TRINITY_DN860_c0_g1~~TRINITY_DN860_c0_g1_i6.p1  ORF type:complete len:167 (-),score=4.42 TRINITY_DN860_c0_g1_i6:261-761(-)